MWCRKIRESQYFFFPHIIWGYRWYLSVYIHSTYPNENNGKKVFVVGWNGDRLSRRLRFVMVDIRNTRCAGRDAPLFGTRCIPSTLAPRNHRRYTVSHCWGYFSVGTGYLYTTSHSFLSLSKRRGNIPLTKVACLIIAYWLTLTSLSKVSPCSIVIALNVLADRRGGGGVKGNPPLLFIDGTSWSGLLQSFGFHFFFFVHSVFYSLFIFS